MSVCSCGNSGRFVLLKLDVKVLFLFRSLDCMVIYFVFFVGFKIFWVRLCGLWGYFGVLDDGFGVKWYCFG